MGYELRFEKVPTGRTHQVNVGGTIQTQLIQAPEGGDEYEFVLAAVVDGHLVPLEHYSAGYVEHMASRDDTALDESTASSSAEQPAAPAEQQAEQPASPPPGEGTAGEGAAAPPAEQQAG